jgi:hypothetical protein
MSFSDLSKDRAQPHVDTPAQAEARAQAMADMRAKADAKVARAAVQRESKKAVKVLDADKVKAGPTYT